MTAGDTDRVELLVVGGGLGGVAAALAGLRLGKRVLLTEETGWLGGQLTVQGVPPDEHPWIEETGCTASYRAFRTAVRRRYRQRPSLTAAARRDPLLNPGAGWVSGLCHEPAVGVEVLRRMLAQAAPAGQLEIAHGLAPVGCEPAGDQVSAVTFAAADGWTTRRVTADYVLDATDTGELLALAGCEHVTGAESRNETGEPHALPGPADPLDQQAITWCFALEHRPGEDHTIDRPDSYDRLRAYRAPFWPGPQLGWTTQDPETQRPLARPLFAGPGDDGRDLWTFRRLVCAAHHRRGTVRDVTLVNWPQVDYWFGPVVGVPDEIAHQHRRGARELSRAFLYWLQADAPRPDGGVGYPGLRLCPDVLGTSDGFAQRPYIRESRRIVAECTVTEDDVSAAPGTTRRGAERFADSVGVGSYRVDLHPSTGGRGYVDFPTWPFQIPLGALIPVRVDNLLPAAKNLGVTHVTNGCYRLHPVEWNVGEAAGALAAFCVDQRVPPRAVRHHPRRLAAFQRLLSDRLRVPLAWPEHIRLQVRR